MSDLSPTNLQAEFEAAQAVASKIFLNARKQIPAATDLALSAIRSELGEPPYDASLIKDHFSRLVSQLQVSAYSLYLAAERNACGEALSDYIKHRMKNDSAADAILEIRDSFFIFDRFFLSLTQSRRQRAGATFEAVVTTLFRALGYPYTAQPELSGSKPDFVLPSVDHYNAYATDCLIFTCKRTLRERWRQVVTEGLTGQAFYLATIDEGLSVPELSRMKERNVIVVVPRDIKSAHYPKSLNVIDFEAFFDHHLDPAMNRWIANGVISV